MMTVVLVGILGGLASALIAWAGFEFYWHFIEMPRFRRAYLANMKALYPEQYEGVFWPNRWQDKIYAQISGVDR